MAKISYSVQGLVAKMKDTVANGYIWLVCKGTLSVPAEQSTITLYLVHVYVE